jgi:ElaB/YqjD/DUF883 family membrane-anchored ribosome-binding protein
MSADDLDPKDKVESPEEKTATETHEQKEAPLLSAAGAANTANKAINETLDKYLAAIGLDLEEIEERIREKPGLYIAISVGVGFVAGGGMASKLGLMLLGVAGRRTASETAKNFGRQVLRQAVGGARSSA